MAAPAVVDKADNAFMMICTALVLFMTIPGIALFYGGLIRGKKRAVDVDAGLPSPSRWSVFYGLFTAIRWPLARGTTSLATSTG
ncbi:ammonium transporter [Citrobacter koseri]|uniref:Ammonium transporter n=1 Tax=Citrobacter koseri TaxID=545 RepID=A0A447UST8_CITKO|nr:ammonium transporter [Citrobacter koseri]